MQIPEALTGGGGRQPCWSELKSRWETAPQKFAVREQGNGACVGYRVRAVFRKIIGEEVSTGRKQRKATS